MSEQDRDPDAPQESGPSDPTAPTPQWQQPTTPPPAPGSEAPYGTPPPPSPYPTQDQPTQGQPEGQYGASPYGAPASPYGTPPPNYYQSGPAQSNTSALILTILSGIGMFTCCGVTIVGLILGIIALTKQATDPVQSAKLTKWGWIAFGVGLVLAVLALVLYIVGIMVWAPDEIYTDF